MTKKKLAFPKTLNVFTLAMINVAAISSVKNWPFISECGFASVFYFILAALVFFFPISLVTAELATGWPKRGGVYLWVKEAFGQKWGFLAVWLQWIENVAYYPTILSFTAATIAYIFDPTLSSNSAYTVFMVLLLFWGATIANLFGMKTSGWISKIGAIFGTLIPAAIIIVLGTVWLIGDQPLQIAFNWGNFLPSFSLKTMVFFTGILLAFAGMEMSAVHALDVEKPQRDYPRAIFLSAILILIPSMLGVLSIGVVVPTEDLSLTAGTMQAFTIFLGKYKLGSFVPFIAALTAIGLFGAVNTWIIGPTKGLYAASLEGNLPPIFHKINERQTPVLILIMQGILSTILSLMFLLMPTVSSGFWILTVLVAQLYLTMYILVFASAIRLRYSKAKVRRSCRVPGGNVGMWIVGTLGILGCSFALIIGYFPPEQIEVGNSVFYTGFLIAGSLVGCVSPFIILLFKKPSWNKENIG
jgi:putative glutamate/gamma-aminobutyrate antiporter